MGNIDQIIGTLTLDEKVSLLSGFNSWYTSKIEKKNIPSIKMSDGPNGVRGDSNSGKSSACFPCAISIGSTWDLELINDIGIALGEEAQAKDVDVLLGPTINIHRHPLGGRHFESFSEDPFLTGKIATNYVQGVQSKNVAACLKLCFRCMATGWGQVVENGTLQGKLHQVREVFIKRRKVRIYPYSGDT